MRKHFITEGNFVSAPAILTAILQVWVQHYQTFAFEVFERENGKVIPYAEEYLKASMPEIYADSRIDWLNNRPYDADWAKDRINSGDCGTTALAVWQVYRNLLTSYLRGEERLSTLELIDNTNHAFLKLDGVYYDTLQPNGQPDVSKMLEAGAPNESVETLTSHTLFQRYILRDKIGAELIRTFCLMFHVPVLPEALVLLNDGKAPHPDNLTWTVWAQEKLKSLPAYAPAAPLGDTSVSDTLDDLMVDTPPIVGESVEDSLRKAYVVPELYRILNRNSEMPAAHTALLQDSKNTSDALMQPEELNKLSDRWIEEKGDQ